MKVILALGVLVALAAASNNLGCKTTEQGREYVGTVSTTKSGRTCQSWSVDNAPHDIPSHSGFPTGESRTSASNYCRNPNPRKSDGPWCYTTDASVLWEYCDIPYCYGIIESVEPRYFGQEGGARLTINGKGFAANQFAHGTDSHLGNKVWLVNEREQRECEVFPDETTQERVVFFAPKNMYDDQWYVRMSVDGVDSPDSAICKGNPFSWTCSFRPGSWITPTIQSLWPRSGTPDTQIKIRGYIFTDKFGSTTETGTNGREQELIKVYAGGQNCVLKNGDEFYGLAMDSESSNYGTIQCKIDSNFVTNSNISYLVQSPYGRSRPTSDVYTVSGDKLFMFQSYAVVDSVSPSSGSTAGGQLLTITGRFFDETNTQVSVGGSTCTVESVSDTEILCRTPAEPSDTGATTYPGGRGMQHDYFNTSRVTFDSLEDLRSRTDKAETLWTDMAGWCESSEDECLFSGPDSYNMRSTGYFVPRRTGSYQFSINCDDHGKVYFSEKRDNSNLTLICSCASYSSNRYDRFTSQTSERFNLTAGTPYYMEVLAYEGGYSARAFVAARFFEPALVQTQAGIVEPELQTVDISTEKSAEELTFTFSGVATGTNTKEVQTVRMTCVNDDDYWQLVMHGARSAKLDKYASNNDVKDAINDMAMIYPDTVSVTSTDITNGKEYTVTFNSEEGNWPEFTTHTSGCTVTVSQTTAGVAGLRQWRLHVKKGSTDLLSDPITTLAPTADQLEEAIGSMFQARCPKSIIAPSAASKKFYQNYEGSTSIFSGSVDSTTEPFCGRSSGLNIGKIFDDINGNSAIDLDRHPQLCFAHRGNFSNYIRLKASSQLTGLRNYWSLVTLFDTSNTDIETWYYSCLNLKTTLEPFMADTDSNFQVAEIELYGVRSYNRWVDDVLISSVVPTDDIPGLDDRRVALPMRLDEVTVATTDISGEYTCTIDVQDCEYNLQMIRVHNAVVSSGSTGTGSSSVTMAVNAGTIKIDRTAKLTAPAGGTWNLVKPDGTSLTGLAADISAATLEDLVQVNLADSDVKVSRTGTCYGYDYQLEFTRTATNAYTVDGSSLTGPSVAISLKERDGNVFYKPIPGDMMRTAETAPQVQVTINNIISRCDGACSHSWDSDLTPSYSSVSPTSGTYDDTVTVTGSGFVTGAQTFVKIGDAVCTPTSVTDTEIECKLGQGAAGTFSVKTYVHGKGLASGAVDFTYEFGVSGSSPAQGSVAGGTKLSIEGTGFTSASTVSVGGSDCAVITANFTNLICLTSDRAAGEVNVNVTVAGTVLQSPDTFEYSAAATLEATDSSPATVSPSAMGTLNVTLADRDVNSDISLALESSTGDLTDLTFEWDGDVASAELPSLAIDTYTIRLRHDNDGYAEFTSGGSLEVILSVEALSVQKGSLAGGTKLLIAGTGFGTDEDAVSVMVGDAPCEVQEVFPTNITCLTGPRSHRIYNGGLDPRWGLGYAWSPRQITIEKGESVLFRWTSPPFVTESVFGVYQTDSLTGDLTDEGFSSGTATSNGQYIHQFNEVGTYYFTSGYVDADRLVTLTGSVIVGERQSRTATVSVKVAGVTAPNDEQSNVTITDSSSCPGGDSFVAGCTDAETTSSDFEFAYEVCSTPELESQDVTQGYIDTDITLTGSGFSTTACENVVMIGDYRCVPTSQSATEVVCNMDAAETPDLGMALPVTMRIANRGYPIVTAANTTFALLPSVSSVDPASGSLNGGTNLTITGAGFMGAVSVTVGVNGPSCEILSSDYMEIICVTSSSAAVTSAVMVQVTNKAGTALTATCTPDTACDYEYSQAATPALTGFAADTATEVSGSSTDLSLEGSGFGTVLADVTVMIGDVECVVSNVTNTALECTVGYVPVANSLPIVVSVAGQGKGVGLNINSVAALDSISPLSGSIHGGQLVTITGSAFHDASSTSVTLAAQDCEIVSVSSNEIVCKSGALGSQSVEAAVRVSSGNINFPNDVLNYTYADSDTPTIDSIDPTSGGEGDVLTLTVTIPSGSTGVTVSIGGAACQVTASSDAEVTCTLGGAPGGDYDVELTAVGLGFAASGTNFSYEITEGTISPNSGSFGGGLLISVGGTGFFSGATVTVCGVACDVQTVGASAISCLTPSVEDDFGTTDKPCDVVVTSGSRQITKANGFTYKVSETPEIDEVSPRRGGTQGGTRITITGEKFGSSGNAVTIDGTTCDIDSQNSTEIQCVTNAPGYSAKSNVVVKVTNVGVSLLDKSDFWYVDVWSSDFTWGGLSPPAEGELVVVPKGQLLLLDQSTPVLKMLLIQGGELVFDEVDLTLRAENILITDGGLLQVGTEEEPFQHDATIELHGQLRAIELPIYGAKCLAVREGTLDLHGKPLRMTWTHLAATAEVGDTVIELSHGQADWPVGATIVIATTGDRHSQKETETRVITAVSADGTQITLDEALEYKHLGVTENLGGGHSIEMRAEVGLLSRNVKVIGSRDQQWSDEIEACPEGFDTGEFATQTCFQGRFGDEIGSDQFGAQIMFHAPEPDKKLAVGRLSYFEINYAGQAFKLGRYPVHWHLNGDMSGSYIRGAAIHETFNRAVNVHGSHNVLLEHNVVYNVMGGALFLEDGIETGNRYLYNLVLFVKASSSLLNDDVTPAAFWATNPNNTYIGNVAAGGTHFGWWYRMKEHPEGPSFTTDYCPRKVPLAKVFNNTVHSQGWFGLWTFQDYYPSVGANCNSNEPEPAKFEKFIVWNCEKGLEFVNAGSLQFHDCLLVNNQKTGLEGKKNVKVPSDAAYTHRGPMVANTVIASYVDGYKPSGSRVGIILPWTGGFLTENVTFINFDSETDVAVGMTSIDGTCVVYCGGYNYHFRGVSFINGDQHIGKFRWASDGIFIDLDGSLTGSNGLKVVAPKVGLLDMDNDCTDDTRFSSAFAGVVCTDTRFARFAFSNPNLPGMLYKDVKFTNNHGELSVPYSDKRMTHKPGWMAALPLGDTYLMEWEGLENFRNLSYSSAFSDVAGDGIIIKHKLDVKPDRVVVKGITVDIDDAQQSAITYDANVHGDFFWNSTAKDLSYLVSDVDARSKRAVGGGLNERTVNFNAYRCYWPDCQPPPDQNTLPPVQERPGAFDYWSNSSTWANGVLPATDDEVTIDAGKWVVADVTLPVLKSLVLKGNLELDYEPDANGRYRDFTLTVDFIIIQGGRLVVGWEDNSFMGNVEIILTGTQDSESWIQDSGTYIGQKAIVSYGGLDLHGKQRTPASAHLSETAIAGSTTISVDTDVDWQADDEIVIATTSYKHDESEVKVIQSVSGRVVTLTSALSHKHNGDTLTRENDETISLAAEVILLTRNIVVRGGSHTDMDSLGFGGRILASTSVSEDDKKLIGWARLSNVQLKHMGQLGYTTPVDPRFAIAFSDTGEVSSVKPSYVKNCAFYEAFSYAVGTFGASGIRISDNVAYRTIDGGMKITGQNHIIERNTFITNIWSGSYEGRYEPKNLNYPATFDMFEAGTGVNFDDNTAVGSERIGFTVAGEVCGDGEFLWTGNRAHSNVIGVSTWPGQSVNSICNRYNSWFVWKNYDYGIYVQDDTSIEVNDVTAVENGVGFWHLVIGPPSLSHQRHTKSVLIKNSYISGQTDYFDCATDVRPTGNYMSLCSQSRSWRIGGSGLVGITTGRFESGSNGLPKHPLKGNMAYPSIDGRVDVEDTTFANFKTRTCGKDTLISSNPVADDLQFPVYMSGITLEATVDETNKVYLYPSNVGKVNPADCVDMECDGMKKNIIMDTDGSFLGAAGAVIDDAAVNWDGDARYGLGDYRIPKVALTLPDNTRVDPPAYKGIIRTDGCTYVDAWQGIKCPGANYDLLVIESMDEDTELRRLSPISVVSDNGYVDLLNGPQDHGWCSGYTCQKRISTFWAAVATAHSYEIHMTSTNPQKTRFFLLNENTAVSVRIAVYYHSPLRLDVFSAGVLILPTNAHIKADGNYELLVPTTADQYLPPLSASAGQNYFDRSLQLQYIVLRGNQPVEVVIKPVVVLSISMPPVTIDDFFGANLINNLAALLQVPESKIRIVNVVRETGGKRSTDGTTIDIEIGDPPQAGSSLEDVDSGDLNRDVLVNLTRKVVDSVQLGTLGDALNLTITGVGVQEPLPEPENSTESDWAERSSLDSLLDSLQVPSSMVMEVAIVAEREQQPFPTQPKFAMYDAAGNLVDVLGSRTDPWKVTATLRAGGSDADAQLVGNVTCGFKNGWCNFTNLGISHSGSGYIIDFAISDPVSASSVYNDVSESISVSGAQLAAGFSYVPERFLHGEIFNVSVDIRDDGSDMRLEDIAWKGHAWTATLSLYNGEMSPGSLAGTLTKTFDPVSGVAVFDDLNVTMRGRYALSAAVTSSPTDFSLSGISSVFEPVSSVATSSGYDYIITLRLFADFDAVAAGWKMEMVEAAVYNYLMDKDDTISYHDFNITRGSIYVTLWATGEQTLVEAVIAAVAADLSAGLSLALPGGAQPMDAYLFVDGAAYNGLVGSNPTTETTTVGPKSTKDNTTLVIALSVVAVLLVTGVVIVVVAVMIRKNQRVKSHESDGSHGSSSISVKSQRSISRNAVGPGDAEKNDPGV